MSNIHISIVIPVCNEEEIIEQSISQLINDLQATDEIESWELILVENGSKDHTYKCVEKIAARYGEKIRVAKNETANYGFALKTGMKLAKSDFIYTFNADYGDVKFIVRTLPLLDKNSVIIGSKGHPESIDRRPFYRRFLSKIFTLLLKRIFKFPLHDTHGIVAWRKADIMPVLNQTNQIGGLFDTELILRSVRSHLAVTEVPVTIYEKRPSRSSILKRIILYSFGLVYLRWTLPADN